MMRRTFYGCGYGLLALLIVLPFSGCKQSIRACKSGTLFLHLELDAASGAADSLAVDVVLTGGTKHGTLTHKPGALEGTAEIDFAGGYPSTQMASVTVTALLAGTPLGSGTQSITFSGGCASLDVRISATSGDGGTDGSADGGGDAGDAGGVQCTAASCPTGTCVDGVCCDTPCTGQCEACDVAGSIGTCVAVSGPPHGGRPACAAGGTTCGGTCDGMNRTGCGYAPATTTCVAQSCTNGTKTIAVNCDGAGTCPMPQVLDCTPAMCNAAGTDCLSTCTGDNDCTSIAGKPYCDHGACTVNKPNGRGCGGSGECNTGNCVDGVCCDQPCTGQCQACDNMSSAGTCSPVTSGAPHGSVRAACNGGGNCLGVCAPGQTQMCTYSAISCGGGTCTDGTNTPTVFCANGSCPGTNPALCANNLACNPGGTTGCKTGSCGSDADCQAGFYCAAGGACVAQKHKGDSCAPSSDCEGVSGCGECDTGQCVDGVCCDAPCTDDCQVCNGAGHCTTVGAGLPAVSPRPSCPGAPSCQATCNGSDTVACHYTNGTACGTGQSCANGSPAVVTFGESCQNGSCVAPVPATQNCPGGEICSGSNCNGCMADSDCGANKFCNSSGLCVSQLGGGIPCHLNAAGTHNSACYNNAVCGECGSTLFCVDGYCCTTACAGQCAQCSSNPGTCGAAAAGPPVGNRAACANTTCQQQCNGSDTAACHDPPSEPICQALSCSTATNMVTPQVNCSSGSCATGGVHSCAPYKCKGNGAGYGCATGCGCDGDCVGNYYCSGGSGTCSTTGAGTCVSKRADGSTCTAGDQCTNGNCVIQSGSTGVCCHTACSYAACQVCDGSNGNTLGTCGPAANTVMCAGSTTCPAYCSGTATEQCVFVVKSCGLCRTCQSGACVTTGIICGSHCCGLGESCKASICQ
jgi:hypothetical protein